MSDPSSSIIKGLVQKIQLSAKGPPTAATVKQEIKQEIPVPKQRAVPQVKVKGPKGTIRIPGKASGSASSSSGALMQHLMHHLLSRSNLLDHLLLICRLRHLKRCHCLGQKRNLSQKSNMSLA